MYAASRQGLKKQDHLKDLDVDGMIVILKWTLNIGWESADFIHVARGREK